MINFFLSRDLTATKQSLSAWKWLYERKEYPHIIVRYMLQDCHTMSMLWNDFENDLIPKYTQIEAIFQMESLYAGKLTTVVEPQLEELLDRKRSKHVGGISYAYYEGLAKAAENDDSLLEEIEFSYIFHYLLNRCVLYLIGYCQAGNNIKTSLGMLTRKTIEDTTYLSYDQAKYFFQEVCVKDYVRKHAPDGMQENYCVFLGDKYSHATSNFATYVYKTPNLCDYIKTCLRMTSLDELLDSYIEHMQQYGKLTPIIHNRITNIRRLYATIYVNVDKLLSVNKSKRLDDDFDLREYHRRIANRMDVVEYFSTCMHPYVCSQIALDLLKNNPTSAKGLVYLQKALNSVFSFPNIFWNNQNAICGCTDALQLFMQLLSRTAAEEFEKTFDISLFKLQYLLLRRSISMCEVESQLRYYARELATFISTYTEDFLCEGLNKDTIECRASFFYGDNKYSTTEYQLAEILFTQLESNIYNLYSIGNFRLGESQIADIIQYLKSGQQISISLFLSNRNYSTLSGSTCISSSSWSRPFTAAEQYQIDIATLKDNVSGFERFLDKQGIECFYHFTDRANLDSIRREGLFSYRYLKRNHIKTYPGGDAEMQRLDQFYDLDNHIRLSFCKRHPMGWRLKMCDNRDFVVLKIDRRVALSRDTLFSNINAINPMHQHGGELSDLKAVNFDAVNAVYSTMDSWRHEQMTAEVMVKKNIPIDYILNIDNPESF